MSVRLTKLWRSVFRLVDISDAGKELDFDISELTHNTIRTVTMPNANVDLGVVAGTSDANADIAMDSLILADTSGEGILVGNVAVNDWGWRDIESDIVVRGVGATDPSWTQINGGPFYAYDFAIGDFAWAWFHVPHDIVPSSDIHFHTHYMVNGTNTNTTKWEYTYTYAKGFAQAAFSTSGTAVNSETAGTGTAYTHIISETDAVTISGLTEPDGLIGVRLSRVTNGGTENTDTHYVLKMDIHYQSTNMATLNKAPSFYGT